MASVIPPIPIDAPFASYNWVDWYQKVRNAINAAQTVQWTSIVGQPTTLAGYGITDGVSLTGTQNLSNKSFVPTAGVGLAFVGVLNNGAGAATGTLTNAPAAGNPTKWIAINDNGTTRYIPAW